jgi:hypothetical protein
MPILIEDEEHPDRKIEDGPIYHLAFDPEPYIYDVRQTTKYLGISRAQLYICFNKKSPIRKAKGLPYIPSMTFCGKRFTRRADLKAVVPSEPTPLKSFLTPRKKQALVPAE